MRPTPGLLWVQFDGDPWKIGTADAIEVRGSDQNRWSWAGPDSPITFRTSGDVTVRLTAGVGGAAFDQFVLSPLQYLEKPPAGPVVPKPK